MRRVVILGQTCAGKSTVAGILSRRLNLPLIDLDAIHYVQGQTWVQREMDEKRRLVAEAFAGGRWVVDGYSSFMKPALLSRADGVVWIDLPPFRVAPRVVTRTFRRWIRGEPVCGDNRERPYTLVTRESLLLYLYRNGHRNAAKYASAFEELGAAGAQTLRFDSTRAAVEWARGIDSTPESCPCSVMPQVGFHENLDG